MLEAVVSMGLWQVHMENVEDHAEHGGPQTWAKASHARHDTLDNTCTKKGHMEYSNKIEGMVEIYYNQ